jgi:CubicO group peptidase (beta-lactamase class C family)
MAAQDTQADRWTAAVEAFQRFTVLDSTVGGALVLVRDGEIVREHYVGFQDRHNRIAATPNTIWHWGSITKTLTAVAIMQLADSHYFGEVALLFGDLPDGPSPWLLDQSVTRFVPELRRINDPFGSIDSVTVRMLLSHSSGLQNPTWPWGGSERWQPFEPTEWDQLVAMMPYMQLQFAPGSRYGYSNPGFIYLARAMQAITGDPWQGRIYKALLMPLGLEASYFGETPLHLEGRRSHNYSVEAEQVVDQGSDFDPGITIPNGGWNAPVTDIARWMGFLAGSSDAATQARYDALLPRDALEHMWEPVVRVSDTEQMGLSFFLREVGGQRLVGHTGTQANFRSFFWLNPATRTAVIGVVNTSGAGGNQAGARFAAMMGEAMRALSP